MRTIYIDSYYQMLTYKNRLKKELPDFIRAIIDKIISSNEVLRVSYSNLKLIENLETFSLDEDEVRYITALYSDVEVAIQEKRLLNIAESLGFNVHLKRSNDSPVLEYLEEYSIEGVDLKKGEVLDGDIYVINTHGKRQSIDGSYYQAIYNKINPERILVDACSSAARGFPMKNSGNKSAIEAVADECIKAGKDNTFEIVGYNYRFNTNKSKVSACAAFANRNRLLKESDLTLITLADRKKQLIQIKELKQTKAKEKKLYHFEKAISSCSEKEALTNSLIDVSSKFLGKILYIQTHPEEIEIAVAEQKKAIELLADMTTDNKNTLGLINNISNKNYKETKKKLKNKKKEYLDSVDEATRLSLAQRTIEICNTHYFTASDRDFLSSIELLESLKASRMLSINKEQKLENLKTQQLANNVLMVIPIFQNENQGNFITCNEQDCPSYPIQSKSVNRKQNVTDQGFSKDNSHYTPVFFAPEKTLNIKGVAGKEIEMVTYFGK